MRKLIFSLPLLAVLWACGSKDQEKPKETFDFTGNWVSTDYVDHLTDHRSPKMVMQDIAFYVTEMVFDTARFKDSLVVYNGQKESAHLPFKRTGDTLSLKLNGDIETKITFDPADSTVFFIDKKLNRVFRFKKAAKADLDPSYEMPLAFPTLVNKFTFAGIYDFFENNGPQSIVEFTSFGLIKGWKNFDSYAVVVNGADSEANENDLLICQKKDQIFQYFTFDATKKDTIVLHNTRVLSKQDEPLKLEKMNIHVLMIRRKP